MVTPLSRNLIYPIFGEYYGNKLIRFLSDCCQPRILIAVCATCAGLNPSGVQQYQITASATYNISISGITSLLGYLSPQPFPNWSAVSNSTFNNLNLGSASIFVGPISANVPVVAANITTSAFSSGTYYAMVTDNRGNYSNLLQINFPNCGNSSSSSSPSTPESTSQT